MSVRATRGRVFLIVIFALMGLTYLAERAVYHAVAGAGSLLASLVICAVLVGLGWLIYRGHGWLRWLVAAFFVLNGLGSPSGMAEAFGPALSLLIALALLAAHLGCALALCFAPGVGAFLRSQRPGPVPSSRGGGAVGDRTRQTRGLGQAARSNHGSESPHKGARQR